MAPRASDAVRARALATLSWTTNVRGDGMAAFALAEEGLAICRSHDEPLITWQCLLLAGVGAHALGELRPRGRPGSKRGCTQLHQRNRLTSPRTRELMRNMHIMFAACLGWSP